MSIKYNGLMYLYLSDYHFYDLVKNSDQLDWNEIETSLPKELLSILSLPVLKDPQGHYLIGEKANIELIQNGPDYKVDDHTDYERSINNFHLWSYPNINDEKRLKRNLKLWAKTYLSRGLFFSFLLFRKLQEIEGVRFKVILTYTISSDVQGRIWFHTIRENEYFIPDNFEKQPFVEGILTIE